MSASSSSRLQTNKYLAAIGLLILSSVYLPLTMRGDMPVSNIASLVAVICFVLLFVGAKKFISVLPVAIAYFVLYAITASHVLGSIVLVLFTSVSLAANEMVLSRGKAWKIVLLYATIPVSVAVSYFMTQNIFVCILSAFPGLIFTLLGISVAKKKNRKSVIILLCGGFILLAIALVGVYMLLSQTDFYDLHIAYVDGRDMLMDYVLNYSVEMNGETVPLFADIPLARQLFISLSNSIPSVLIAAIIILAYFLYNYQASMLLKFGGDEYITEDILRMDISSAAAAVYLITFVFSITTDSYGNVPFGSVVCQNIYMILTPALVYSGFVSVKSFFKRKKIKIGFLLIFPLVLLATTGYLVMILSLLGIICIFARDARAWAEKK